MKTPVKDRVVSSPPPLNTSTPTNQQLVRDILIRGGLRPSELAQYLGTSLVSVIRWERCDTRPDPAMRAKLEALDHDLRTGKLVDLRRAVTGHVFASRGARRVANALPLFEQRSAETEMAAEPKAQILARLRDGQLWGDGTATLAQVVSDHVEAAETIDEPAAEGVSAGKNTYTYDAHTYHTKVPPQGIAAILKKYLPHGGLVLDPFAGSGMTGVAALTLGLDVVLNELSPAASFIADRFTRSCDPAAFATAVKTVCISLSDLRRDLYTTYCRTCGKDTEILFTVWSYRVRCDACGHDFILWDHCRRYGKTVREHKILSEFPCPHCTTMLKKSRLRRFQAEPVFLGYKCCSRQQVEHPLIDADRDRIRRIEANPPRAAGFTPDADLPDGTNLCQPKRHGLTSVDRFYTPRNLAAMSHLWREIHRVNDDQIAGFLAFVFTSLYRRVTRLSEYRFWGGSGNTANFNVPYIFDEANVFVAFERKARTILDHLETTARAYRGRAVVRTGSATRLHLLPDDSVDLVFTDPPFGANINYSEMNILWESWLRSFTDTTEEAIVNRFQGKDVVSYGRLMTDSLREAYRILRPGHWMVLVFMNSSREVWQHLHNATVDAGFSLERVDIFDKQHGTFKQFVSENTAGCDLLLHCRKAEAGSKPATVERANGSSEAVQLFLSHRQRAIPRSPYLHVRRRDEIDYRLLYSEYLAGCLHSQGHLMGFAEFRSLAASTLELR